MVVVVVVVVVIAAAAETANICIQCFLSARSSRFPVASSYPLDRRPVFELAALDTDTDQLDGDYGGAANS